MVLQSTERRRRPPIVVEPAPPVDRLSVEVVQVLDAAKSWDADPEKFGSVLRAPRLGWAGLFEAAASIGLEPRRLQPMIVDVDGLPAVLA